MSAIVVAESAIVVAALRMRVEMDPSRGFLGARATEVVWTLLPALLIAAMAVLSYQVFRDA
jgi:heme/copper-type cytochrome/quinol oxidase subunit 2